ncbi:hypothetical protein CGMCC3_g3190 [Colletotrichum fructicola]|nr:uncharacterized protein CGMCC3_g3190 [Colletotrichum fructicola]KAE9581106.1 hypothetical protein CGMCC3_g3190 [Colletotrichum fructicola]
MTSQCCVSEYMAPLALCSIAGTETAASDGAGKKVDKDQVRQSQLSSAQRHPKRLPGPNVLGHGRLLASP